MHGNKRTARAIAVLVSAKLHCPWNQHDPSGNDRKRTIYQMAFSRAVWLRDYASLKTLHNSFKEPQYHDRISASAKEKRVLYDKLFGTKVEGGI